MDIDFKNAFSSPDFENFSNHTVTIKDLLVYRPGTSCQLRQTTLRSSELSSVRGRLNREPRGDSAEHDSGYPAHTQRLVVRC